MKMTWLGVARRTITNVPTSLSRFYEQNVPTSRRDGPRAVEARISTYVASGAGDLGVFRPRRWGDGGGAAG